MNEKNSKINNQRRLFSRWRSLDFRLLPHLGKDTYIITGFEDILQQLEESQVRYIIETNLINS